MGREFNDEPHGPGGRGRCQQSIERCFSGLCSARAEAETGTFGRSSIDKQIKSGKLPTWVALLRGCRGARCEGRVACKALSGILALELNSPGVATERPVGLLSGLWPGIVDLQHYTRNAQSDGGHTSQPKDVFTICDRALEPVHSSGTLNGAALRTPHLASETLAACI